MSETSAFLPPILADIAERLGYHAANEITEQLGGMRLYIPRPESLSHSHPIAAALGLELAGKLCQHYAASSIEIPRAAAALRAERDAQLLADHAGGATLNSLARRYQLTERGVRKILARCRDTQPSPQLDLFSA